VTWHQAVAYAQWAGKRLPSAAEWDRDASVLVRSDGLWEWTSDEVKPRGLGRKENKRALKGGPPQSAASTTSAWPDEELEYVGFRCAISVEDKK
jgi:formylglycine-generating enzyme required for sulfatase activity